MAQARRQPGALETTAEAVGGTVRAAGDVAQGTVGFIGKTINFVRDTATYTLSLFNLDGGVGAALGLAAGTATALVVGIPGALAGLPIIGGTLGFTVCAATAGFICGGHLGKDSHTKPKKPKAPSMLNKEAVMGFGLGAAGQALAISALPFTGPLATAAAIGLSVIPAVGAYFGGQVGAQRMAKDYAIAQQQAATSGSKGHGIGILKEQAVHPAQRSYKNSVSEQEWAEASSMMRDSSNGRGEGGHAAKVLADRAAAQELAQQHQTEA